MPKALPFLGLAALALAGAAKAEPLAGSQIQARAAGGEFRGDTHSFRGFESQIWRLAPGGQARAVATVKKGLSALSASMIEFGDTGSWRIEGNMLCVEWTGENRRFNGCYAVEAQQGNHVRLVGPAQWEGTLDR
ncbi:MAG TPA: hypothetical protein VIF14_18815 [Alphaproteobacteria bacterium]|jgi:hypothetical protein